MKKLSEYKNYKQRRKDLEKELNISLSAFDKVFIDDPNKVHCENLVGAISLPVGVAGPILTKNLKRKAKNYYIPLATTEGALVASVNRGCKAINQSDGVVVNEFKVGT